MALEKPWKTHWIFFLLLCGCSNFHFWVLNCRF